LACADTGSAPAPSLTPAVVCLLVTACTRSTVGGVCTLATKLAERLLMLQCLQPSDSPPLPFKQHSNACRHTSGAATGAVSRAAAAGATAAAAALAAAVGGAAPTALPLPPPLPLRLACTSKMGQHDSREPDKGGAHFFTGRSGKAAHIKPSVIQQEASQAGPHLGGICCHRRCSWGRCWHVACMWLAGGASLQKQREGRQQGGGLAQVSAGISSASRHARVPMAGQALRQICCLLPAIPPAGQRPPAAGGRHCAPHRRLPGRAGRQQASK
jgi:hypothetical protein